MKRVIALTKINNFAKLAQHELRILQPIVIQFLASFLAVVINVTTR